MQHLKIGHFTDTERGTGVSVFLFDAPACGVYQVCGSSPASRELHALSLEARAAELHALVLTGGSAYGLAQQLVESAHVLQPNYVLRLLLMSFEYKQCGYFA